jgi:ATP-dependent DNA helicase RecQ
VTATIDKHHIESLARDKFGYESLHPGQIKAIESVLAGHDTLAVMPTGAGKSAIYQIATLLSPGPAVIVSPLIALQRDQLAAIQQDDIGEAAIVNSAERAVERREAWDELDAHRLKYLFLAPEQFANNETLAHLTGAGPSLFVVDEAHCISEWGHDFRPDYLKLGAVVDALGHPSVLALTATASPPVRTEIVERLHMREPRLIVQGFNRPNIWLGVERFEDEYGKRHALLDRVEAAEKPGIVYAATHKHAEELAAELGARGLRARYYHAGLKPHERDETQEAFMRDDLDVIVATTAFGMGIDKPNVRFVFHHDISESVDAYYQEIGRAGRDGAPARAILFYRPEDLGLRRFFAGSGHVDVAAVERVAHAVQEHQGPVAPSELRAETDLSPSKLGTAISRLEEVGVLDVTATGEVTVTADMRDAHTVAETAVQAEERHHLFVRSRIEMMQGYAEVLDCRRGYLLNYFGEPMHEPCGYCDNCDAGIVVVDDKSAEPFPIDSRVAHQSWGEGLIVRYEGDKMVVLFDKIGYKTLATALVVANGLLHTI